MKRKRKRKRKTARSKYDPARFYPIEGKELPSVTTVLGIIDKPGLRYWYAKHGAQSGKKMREAGDLGSEIHAGIQYCLRVSLDQPWKKPEVSKWARKAIRRWQVWFKKSGLKTLQTEEPVHSLKYGYAGTPDFYGKTRGGKYIVIDWKTGKGIYPEMFLQTAAYKGAYREMGKKVDLCVIVQVPRDGGKIAFKVAPKTARLDDFLHALALWRWKRRMDGMKVGYEGGEI